MSKADRLCKKIWMVALALVVLLSAKTMVMATENTESNNTTESETTTEAPVVRNGWDENKTKYYVNNDAVTGVYKIDGKLYLFKDNGKLYKKKGLQNIKGNYYCFAKDYSLKTGFVKIK